MPRPRSVWKAADPWGVFHASLALGRSWSLRGEFARATGILGEGLAECRERELLFGTGVLGPMFAHALASDGRIADAIEVVGAQAERAVHPNVLCLVGETYRLAGRAADAAPWLARGLEMCAARGERGFEGWGHLMCGQLAACADPVEEAVAARHFQHARDLGDARGMRPLVAHAHLNLGELHVRGGRHAEAGVELSRAAAIYEATGMTSWGRRAALALSRGA